MSITTVWCIVWNLQGNLYTDSHAQTQAHASTFTSTKNVKLKDTDRQLSPDWHIDAHSQNTHSHSQTHLYPEKHVCMCLSGLTRPPNAHPHLCLPPTLYLTFQSTQTQSQTLNDEQTLHVGSVNQLRE